MATDPVCGMHVDEATAELKLFRDNRTYYFCNATCMATFAEPERELRSLRWKLVVAWPLSMTTLILTYLWHPEDWAYAAFGLATIVQFYPGLPFYRGTWDALRSRIANMDVLIAVGTTVAYVYSAVALWIPSALPAIYYFDASAFIVTLILTGSYLEHLTRERARGALRELQSLLPTTCLVLRNGEEVEIPAGEVVEGDRLVVKPGGKIAADGVVREGQSEISEALITGESLPVDKAPGDRVLAGTVNGRGRLLVEATKVGEDTTVSQIGTLLAAAESSRVPIQQLADRIASYFVPAVLGLAVLAAIGWALFGAAPFNIALLVFVTVSITACPCAFGLATPAAIVMGTGRAAKEGILFKGGDTIEKASRIDAVLTDKTGTLTVGHPELTDLVPATGRSTPELLSMAAAVEDASEHPLSRAVVERAKREGVPIPKVEGFTAVPGEGLKGIVGGASVSIRSGRSVDAKALSQAGLRAEADRLSEEGKAWSLVEQGGAPLGLLGFFDPPAPGVKEAVAALRADGISVVMLTGDHERAAQRVAAEVGIAEYHAALDPAAKLRYLEDAKQSGRHVAYVGDGINDAPALMAADVGIAIGAGTEVAREAGGVILMRTDFRGVALALRVARRTVSKARGNLFWALGYNSVLLPIAAGILVPVFGFGLYDTLPLAGALAMGLSSTTVLLNSFSLRWIALPTKVSAPA